MCGFESKVLFEVLESNTGEVGVDERQDEPVREPVLILHQLLGLVIALFVC